ncbi:lysylphosphatidylglycerol synthase transmembrane domain-containing protein [Herbidospora cretacea]|uniref:lysylphosphatidylglycerol synthase transmembrane domain-containing protein n=1 Tax=Herbidospora cretacea TaxID=28444 RepID=UPI001E33374D|nr:YbhN family protein [Herbidospora cretacea]
MIRRLKWPAMAGLAVLAYLTLRDALPSPSEVWEVIAAADANWLVVAAVFQLLAMAVFARFFRRLLALGGVRVSRPRILAVTFARNAVAGSLPAGPVVSVAYTTQVFTKLGAGKRLIAAVLVLAAAYSGGTFGVLALVALVFSPETRVVTLVVLGGVVVLGVLVFRAGHLIDRMPKVAGQLRATFNTVGGSRRDHLRLAHLALLNWVLDVVSLGAVCVAIEATANPHTVLLGFVAAKTAAALAVVPGGLGVAEVGMAATYIAAGMSGGQAAAVVLLYRLVSYWMNLVIGWIAWILLHDPVRKATIGALARLGSSLSPYVYDRHPAP